MPNVIYGFFPLSCSQVSLFVHFKSSTESKILSFAGSIHDIQNSTVILSLPPTTNNLLPAGIYNSQSVHSRTTLEWTRSNKIHEQENKIQKIIFIKSPQWHRVKLVFFIQLALY